MSIHQQITALRQQFSLLQQGTSLCGSVNLPLPWATTLDVVISEQGAAFPQLDCDEFWVEWWAAYL